MSAASAIEQATQAQTKDLLHAFFDAAGDAIVASDASGRITIFNPGASRMFGYSADDMIGRSINVLMPARIGGDHDQFVARYRRTGKARIIGIGRQVTARHRNGEEFPVDLSIGEAWIGDTPQYLAIMRDLRGRTHLENMLRMERRQAERVLDLVDVVILSLDADGRLSLVNRTGSELFSERGPDWRGRRWIEDIVVAEDRGRVRELLASLRTTDDASRAFQVAEYAIADHAGQVLRFAWRHQRIPPAEAGQQATVLISGSDISQIHEATTRLYRSENQLRLLFTHTPIGMASLALDGVIDRCNDALCEIVGRTSTNLKGHHLRSLLTREDRPRLDEALACLSRTTPRQTVECTMLHPTLPRRAVLYLATVQDPGGEATSYVAQVQDCTETWNANQQLEDMREKLTHSHRLGVVGELATGIAHELNQPLGAIATYADAALRLLDPSALTGDLRYALEQIGAQARRASEVTQRIRGMGRRSKMIVAPVHLNELIEGVMALVQIAAHRKKAPVVLKLAQDLPLIQADEVQLQQVVLNLVANALEALDTAEQAAAGIAIESGATAETAWIAVIDHGRGVAAEHVDQLFHAFFTTRADGTGLGLSMCDTIVRTHGGRLRYEPVKDGGSRFTLELPR